MYSPDGKPYYFVGTTTGLYLSKNIDSNILWVQMGASTIGNMDVEMIDGRITDGLMVAASYGGGAFSGSLTDLVGIDANKSSAHGFFINRIYPNPANDICYLDMNLETSTRVSIQILDINGKLIQNIAPVKCNSGENSIPLNVENLPKGAYLCRVQVNGFVETKKILKM